MIEINFANWLGENHYYLYDVSNGIYFWKNENGIKTAQELYNEFYPYNRNKQDT